jgi:CheY-like chemotaxis protein
MPIGDLLRRVPQPSDRRVVVVIEDDADSREMLRLVLSRMGHDVHVAATGRAGVEVALGVEPQAVLADIELADLDGYGVAEALRAKLGAAVRLVAMTGHQRLRAGARFDAHLVKPVSPEQLAAQVALAPTAPAPGEGGRVTPRPALEALARAQARFLLIGLECGCTFAHIARGARSEAQREVAWAKARAALRQALRFRDRIRDRLTTEELAAIDQRVRQLVLAMPSEEPELATSE